MGTSSSLIKSTVFNVVVVFIFSIFTSSVFACTTDGWLAGAVGAVNADNPINGVARIKGVCGLEVTGQGYVQDGSPDVDDDFIGHFYFLPQFTSGSGTMDLFIAYSDEGATTELFSVKYDGANIILDATAATGGDSVSFPADPTGWNLVEFGWHSGTTGDLWVNSDAANDEPDATFPSGTGLVESVRLGAPNGFDGLVGKATFDEYESRRSLLVGELPMGDSNNDGNITLTDAIGVLREARLFDAELQEGTPDCNLDGVVSLVDAVRILQASRIFDAIPCGN